MGTGVGEEKAGGEGLAAEEDLKYYWEDGELWRLEAIFDGCTSLQSFPTTSS